MSASYDRLSTIVLANEYLGRSPSHQGEDAAAVQAALHPSDLHPTVVSGLIFQAPPDSIGHNNILQAVEGGLRKRSGIGVYSRQMRVPCG